MNNKLDTALKASALLFLIGFFIHNTYLSNFLDEDFDLLRAKYVYIGAVFVLFVATMSFFILIRLDFDYPRNNFRKSELLAWISRLPMLAILVHGALFPYETLLTYPHRFLNKMWAMFITSNLTNVSFLYVFGLLWMTFGTVWEKDAKINKYLKKFFTFIFLSVSILGAFGLIFGLLNANFSKIIAYLAYLFFLFFMYLASRDDDVRGITTKAAVLKSEKTVLSKVISKYFPLIFLSCCLTSFVFMYSKYIYPLIPSSIGGGKSRNVLLYTKNDSISGKLIDESSSWLLVQLNDGTNVKLKSSSLEKIKLLKE